MTPLPAPLSDGPLLAWRLDTQRFAADWDSGEGAYLHGGRWNGTGTRMVYASADPATAILEVAVHKGFKALDQVPHVLTSFEIVDLAAVHVVGPEDVPDPDWLKPGLPLAAQQAFGDTLAREHVFIFIPSTVSGHSWNVIFDSRRATGAYRQRSQEPFVLDPRLHGAAAAD